MFCGELHARESPRLRPNYDHSPPLGLGLRRLSEQAPHDVICPPLHRGGYVGLGVERQRNGTVPEPVANHFSGRVGEEQPRRCDGGRSSGCRGAQPTRGSAYTSLAERLRCAGTRSQYRKKHAGSPPLVRRPRSGKLFLAEKITATRRCAARRCHHYPANIRLPNLRQ